MIAEDVETLQNRIVDVLEDSKAVDISVLDVADVCSFTDRMVLASGTSNRHVNALVGHVVEELKSEGARPLGVEGRETSEWVLVDYGDVVVHIMQKEARAFYDLERLWSDLPDSDGESAGDP